MQRTTISDAQNIEPPDDHVKPCPRSYRAHYLPAFRRWCVLDPAGMIMANEDGNMWRATDKQDAKDYARGLNQRED